MTREEARALVKRQARAWEAEDYDAMVADFTHDGEFVAPGGRWRGPVAIRAAAAAFFENVAEVRVTVANVLLDGDAGAAEWTWEEVDRVSGRRSRTEDAILFTLRDDRIASWREYFDSAELAGPTARSGPTQEAGT